MHIPEDKSSQAYNLSLSMAPQHSTGRQPSPLAKESGPCPHWLAILSDPKYHFSPPCTSYIYNACQLVIPPTNQLSLLSGMHLAFPVPLTISHFLSISKTSTELSHVQRVFPDTSFPRYSHNSVSLFLQPHLTHCLSCARAGE